jgi:signal transduction histidine kinase
MIASQADRCKKIVGGLLHFARQNKVVMKATDLRELVDNSLKLLVIPDEIKVMVSTEAEDTCAELDRDQTTQVLTNLIGNAVQAMPHGGVLTIGIDGGPEEVSLAVRDTGTGIAKDHLSKIFEPFFTTKAVGKGTGMGLAVTYGIVKMHRGNIRVESNTDPVAGPTGTTFTVTLPRHNELHMDTEAFMMEGNASSGAGENLPVP